MWDTHGFDVECVMIVFLSSYVVGKVIIDQIENDLYCKGLNWKKQKVINQIEKTNKDKGLKKTYFAYKKIC